LHELSIALDVCSIAEAHVEPALVSSIVEIGLAVGDRSGVEVGNLEFCLEALLSSPPFGNGVPRIDRTTGEELRVTYVEVDDGDP
jgi:Zn finger protein HypA/HybF involved in hydrogenase expression